MRKRLLITFGATVAMAAAATAYAAFTASGITATSGKLTTATASEVKTRNCTGGDSKAFTITDAKFTGNADFGNPAIVELSGPATFRIKTTVDDASHLGVVDGSFKVHDADTDLHGRFVGTLDATGNFAGFLTADAHKGSKAKILGTLSGSFGAATGFTNPAGAALGTASASTTQAVVVGPVCKKAKEPKPPHNHKNEFKGTISSIDATQVTVTGKGPSTAQCKVDGSSPTLPGTFVVNDKVEVKCENISNVWYLREIEKKNH